MPHEPSTSTGETPPPATLEARLLALEAQVLRLQAEVDQGTALFHAAPGAAFLLNTQGCVLDVNERGAALIGASPERLLGRRLALSFTPTSQAVFASLLNRVLEGRVRQTAEVQVLLADGQLLDVVLEAAFQAEGEPVFHLTATDVTAFKTAHRTLLETTQAQERQLQEQTVRLRQVTDEFERVMWASGRELEGTLTRAEGFVRRSQLETPDAAQEPLVQAGEALRQTFGLLDSLKQYMRMRNLRARTQRVDLGQVLHEVLKGLQPQTAGRDVQVTGDALPVLQGDRQVLQIILREYLANALKFTRTRPQVRLRVLVQETAAEYRIGVADNGVGFSMRLKDRAFELFGKLHPSGLYEGTGLGLAVVRRLCERFGGRAWGEGKVDQGATFWFAWPKVPAGG